MANKIKDTDYLAISARVRAMETTLLTAERMERLLEARSDEEVSKLLQDCGYPELDAARPEAMDAALSQAREELLTDLGDGAPDPRYIDIFKLKYDYHNAKAILKAAAMGTSPDRMLMDMGRIGAAELKTAVESGELDKLPGGRDILMYGEPWQGGGSQLHRYEANKANLAMLNERVGIFCDDTRDAIKGGCFDAREPGYVEGKPGSFWDIGAAVAAWCRSDRLPPHAPSQIVSYVSAHDNFTLWDKLLCVRYEKPEFTARDTVALAQNRLAAGIYLTSFGLPFMQAGEEFARTKKGVGNSYRSSPALNRLDWNRAEQYHALVDYYRGLLALRAAFPRLGSTDRHAPEALQFFALEQPLVGWTLPAVWGDGAAWSALCVFYNPTETACTVPLPAGQWKLLSDGTSSSLWRGPSRIFTGNAPLAPYSATIFGAV